MQATPAVPSREFPFTLDLRCSVERKIAAWRSQDFRATAGPTRGALRSTWRFASGDGHYDELRAADCGLRPAWRQFFDHLWAAGFADLDRRAAMLARQIGDDGVTFNVYRPDGTAQRLWSIDLLPLVVGADDWALIERGVTQRARLLNAIMRDVYGRQRLLRESFLPPALVYGHPVDFGSGENRCWPLPPGAPGSDLGGAGWRQPDGA